MALHEQYTKEISEQLNYVATWLPTVRLKLGDVCDMRGHQLLPMSHLNEYGIAWTATNRPVESDIEYTSAKAVAINLKAHGEPPPVGSALTLAEAGISVSFQRSGAVLLRMAKCSSRRIANLEAVGAAVLRLGREGKWPDGYVVVAEVVEAGASTIIVSQGSGAGMDFVAKGEVAPGGLTLASADAGLQVKRESNIGAKFISLPGLTPLVRVSGLRKRFLRPDQFRSESKPSELAFAGVGYSDFEPTHA